ncbi:hypothetical protein [Methanobrevibacter sp.]|uniref:hypothetical protein n=1 Tax=Methanobrevibacter sp. TaxID=66852 RepID=UPI00386C081D
MKIKITTDTEHTEKKIKQLKIIEKQINQLINTESILYEKLREKITEYSKTNGIKYHDTMPNMGEKWISQYTKKK